MSCDFTVTGRPLPAGAFGAITGRLRYNVATGGGSDSWPPGLLRVYRPNISTRSVEVDAQGGTVTVSVYSGSCAKDYELALDIVEQCAALCGATEVEPESGDRIAVDALRRRYDSAWADDEIAAVSSVVARLASEVKDGATVALAGPNRTFLIGPRLLAELRSDGPDEELPARLIAAMRRTQWPGRGYSASVLRVEDPDGVATRLAVLTPGTRTILPDVDFIALHDDASNQLLRIAPAAVADVLAGHAHYLDERHLLVEPLDKPSWDALLEQARAPAVTHSETIRLTQGLNHRLGSREVGVMNIWNEQSGSAVASLSIYDPAAGQDGDVRVRAGDELVIGSQSYRVVDVVASTGDDRAWLTLREHDRPQPGSGDRDR